MPSITLYFLLIMLGSVLNGCVMTEEVKRIKASKNYQNKYQEITKGYLNGKQIFIRSCNTCHPGGKASPTGPNIENFASNFKTTNELKQFILKGKASMPAQTILTTDELENLVQYLYAEFQPCNLN